MGDQVNFRDWLTEFDEETVRVGCSMLPWLDNLSAHYNEDLKLTDVLTRCSSQSHFLATLTIPGTTALSMHSIVSAQLAFTVWLFTEL